MTYEDAVAEAAACLSKGERADWRLAELTHGHTNRVGAREAGRVPMERWCADVEAGSSVRVRFGTATGYRYARIWATHGAALAGGGGPPAKPFKEAYAEVDGTPDRARMMKYEADRLLKQGTPEQKAETAAQLLRDPDVRAVARDAGSDLGGAVFGVSAEQREFTARTAERTEARAGARFALDPTDRALRSARAVTLLTGALSDYARRVAELLPEITELPADDHEGLGARLFLREALARAQGATEQVAGLVATGAVGGDVDDFLKSVLGEAPGR